jgi:uncharacterized protein GlcG (DUF336 family)
MSNIDNSGPPYRVRVVMPNVDDRIGSQNVVRVLSNASAPPTSLINLGDVTSTLRTEDGMILVWDLASEKFIMTSVIDSSSTTIEGIAYFENTTNSSLPTNGALIVSGGVGIGENLNIGGSVAISGIATFSSNLDINAAVDILNNLVVNQSFRSSGITTLASSGGITTTGGDFYVGGDLYVADDIVFDELTARNATLTGSLNVTGIATFQNNVFVIGTLTAGLIDGGEY